MNTSSNFCFRVLEDPIQYNIRVTNYVDLCIRYILQYSVYDATITKEIDIMRGQSKGYFVPIYAYNVCLNILNCSFPMTNLIYHECVEERRNICYEIQGTSENPICIKNFC